VTAIQNSRRAVRENGTSQMITAASALPTVPGTSGE
jgi:hypothetical protein